MRTALIGLIIMQITLVPDSVTPGTILAAILNGRHFSIWWTSAIFKFLKFYNMAAEAPFLNYNLTLNSAIFLKLLLLGSIPI